MSDEETLHQESDLEEVDFDEITEGLTSIEA